MITVKLQRANVSRAPHWLPLPNQHTPDTVTSLLLLQQCVTRIEHGQRREGTNISQL